MRKAKYINTLGFKVFSDDLDLINVKNTSPQVINTISPNSYGLSTCDAEFYQSLKKSDYLVLDGVYFALASILLQGKNIKKNQGPEVFEHFIERANINGYKVFFLGSSPETLEKIEEKAHRLYPNIKIRSYAPPFKSDFSEEDNNKMVDVINEYEPDILFIGMTCPKQEKWSVKHKYRLKSGLIISIGNVFDWFAGTQKAIHSLWYKLRLAWLIRIFLRPEIFKRNIGNQMKFFSDVILLFFKLKKFNNA
ncbi:WecB/TagA/CpsF family glycosyltransferase [Mucilaginibacter calamicampi]|uniref:WecB/TagA/CpsF family glycosyltransferase n=1 Tax=Mucilaginibacter calamicampi TaxID=1302352 RepID=A0ABW2Z217_9SPHI